MDLEVSISFIDPSFGNNTLEGDEVMNISLTPQNPFCEIQHRDNSDSGHYETESDTSTLLDSSQNSPIHHEEEENVNRNVIQSSSFDENVPIELDNCETVDKDYDNNQNQFASSSKVNLSNSSSNTLVSENTKEAVRHITTSDGKSVLIQTSTPTRKSGNKISRNSSHGPLITNIRIGTPVKRSASVDQENSETSEVEYMISVSSQSNVKVQMTTSPSIHRVTCGDQRSCTSTPESVSSQSNVKVQMTTSPSIHRVTCDDQRSCTSTPERKQPENNITNISGEIPFPEHEIQVANQTVRLRAKKNPNRNWNTLRSYTSQTEEMKRHIAEISQLRHALEQKILMRQSSPSKYSYHDSPRETRRPVSAYGYSRLYDSPSKEGKRPCDNQTYLRTSQSYTSSPVNWRNNARNTIHVTDPKKLKFLLDGQQRSNDPYASNLYNEYKSVTGSIGHRSCSLQPNRDSYCAERNNRNYSPYITPRSSTPFYDCIDNMASQYNTPMNSPGPSSLKTPKKNNMDDPPIVPKGAQVEEDGRVNYYPNCDATIWLRSCDREITEPLSGEQIGQVPLWISGTLIRNGPGRLEVGEHKYNHLFDGSALLHRFYFSKGKVTYQNRFLKSRSYLRDTKAQRIVVNYFGTRAHPDPCRTILQNIASKFDFEEHFTDNAQISLYPYGDGLYALTETPFIFRIDPETLETHEKVDLTKCIAVLTHTAHPHVDRDGTVYNIGQGVGPFGPRYHICKFPNPKTDRKGKTKTPFDQAQIVGSVSARWCLNPCYMHSFAMTDNYWVIIEQPLVVSVPKILKVVLRQDALIDALQWFEKETKIHVIRRDTGATITTQYVTETFFFLHTINAYEDRGHIILDICTYKNAEMLHCMYVEALKNASYDPTYAQMFRGRPKRWAIPLRPNKDASIGTNLVTLPDTKCQGRWLKKNIVYLTPELLSDIGCEVPRIYYEKYNGRPYRYFYAICSDVDHPNPGTLVKVDVVHKTHVEWSEDNVYPSEPIFVPHPLAKNEDDGVVMAALLRAKGLNNQVCMLILDAATFKERARVEFVAPGPVPKCLHGWFVPEGTLTVHKQDNAEKRTNNEE